MVRGHKGVCLWTAQGLNGGHLQGLKVPIMPEGQVIRAFYEFDCMLMGD